MYMQISQANFYGISEHALGKMLRLQKERELLLAEGNYLKDDVLIAELDRLIARQQTVVIT